MSSQAGNHFSLNLLHSKDETLNFSFQFSLESLNLFDLISLFEILIRFYH